MSNQQRVEIHDPITKVDLRISPNGELLSTVYSDGKDTNALTRAYEYDASNKLIYIGAASAGTSVAAAGWRISKITYDGNGNPSLYQWAGGVTTFTNTWNSRASYSYS